MVILQAELAKRKPPERDLRIPDHEGEGGQTWGPDISDHQRKHRRSRKRVTGIEAGTQESGGRG